MVFMDNERINRYILIKQHLTVESKDKDVVNTVKDLVGMHAQVSKTPYLSLLARCEDFSREMLDDELYNNKSLGRIRCLRRTMFIITQEIIVQMMTATRKYFDIPTEKYPKYLGMTKDDFNNMAQVIVNTVKSEELSARLIRESVGSSNNISFALSQMCDLGLLARGKPSAGWKSNSYTYHPFDDFYGKQDFYLFDEYSARKHIVGKYIERYGPVCEMDILWWTGFLKTETRNIIKDMDGSIEKINIEGTDMTYYMDSEDKRNFDTYINDEKPVVNLLPAMDPYIMGYKERSRIIDGKFKNFLFDKNGNATSAIYLNGRAIGIWDIDDAGIKLHLFGKTDEKVFSKIIYEAKKIGFFINEIETDIRLCDEMNPLIQRTAGGFMSPLSSKGVKN
jgi:hypothetical protein